MNKIIPNNENELKLMRIRVLKHNASIITEDNLKPFLITASSDDMSESGKMEVHLNFFVNKLTGKVEEYGYKLRRTNVENIMEIIVVVETIALGGKVLSLTAQLHKSTLKDPAKTNFLDSLSNAMKLF